MHTLVIDTSTERGVVSFFKEETCLYHVDLPFGLQNSNYLLPEIEAGLKQTKLKLCDFTLIVVGIGPGSYTGIRVGAIVAKTLSFANNTPLVGICSLSGFISAADGEYYSVIDAKIGGIYLQKNKKKGDKIMTLSEPQILSLEEAAKILTETQILITPNASQLQLKLSALTSHQWLWEERYPSSLYIAQLGKEKFHQGELTEDSHLDLMYMRKTQAEIEKLKQK